VMEPHKKEAPVDVDTMISPFRAVSGVERLAEKRSIGELVFPAASLAHAMTSDGSMA